MTKNSMKAPASDPQPSVDDENDQQSAQPSPGTSKSKRKQSPPGSSRRVKPRPKQLTWSDLGVTETGMEGIANFAPAILQEMILPAIQDTAANRSEYITDLDDLYREYCDFTGANVSPETFHNWCRALKIGFRVTLQQPLPPPTSREPEEYEEPVPLRRSSGAASGVREPQVLTRLSEAEMFAAPPSDTPIPLHVHQARKMQKERQPRGFVYAGNTGGVGNVLEEIG